MAPWSALLSILITTTQAGVPLAKSRVSTSRAPAQASASASGAPAAGAAPTGVVHLKKSMSAKAYPKNPLLTDQEDMDRMVDEAAVSSKEAAISNLKRLLSTKKGAPDEAMLIWRLADMEWRATKSHFRVGMSRGPKTRSNTRYEELMTAVIEHTTVLLTRYPKFKDTRDVLLRRGRAYQEMKKTDLAKNDYLTFIQKFPKDPQIVPVRLMAADILFDDNKYTEVLGVLAPVDMNEMNAGLNGAVAEKQSFSFFHLDRFPEAFAKGEWLLAYDRRKGLDQEQEGHYDQVLAMMALFYGTTIEKQLPGYDLDHAYAYFVKLEGGKVFGKLSNEFCLVLRSKDLQQHIFTWKELVMRNAPGVDDIAKTLVSTYDAAITWKNYVELSKLETDFRTFFSKNPNMIVSLQKEEYYRKFKAEVLDFAERIYKTVPVKEAKVQDYQVIADPYLRALSAYMTLADAKDPMKAKVRFRMGEFYVGLRDWEKAQAMFTEVYSTNKYVSDPKFREEARVKAMTARYDYFKDRGVIPKDLKAMSLKTPTKSLPSDVAEWIKWLDEVSPTKKNDDAFEKLVFEANRVIYSYGQIEVAYKRMLHFVGTRPNSKLTPPTAALVMDTLIESEAWVAVRTLAQKFLTMPNVATDGYRQKLEELEKDAHFKILAAAFKNKDFPKVLALGEEHIKLYPNSKKRVDVLALMGKAALEQGNSALSLTYLNQVAIADPKNESANVAYFIRAQDLEKKFLFREAFLDYQKLLTAPAASSGIAAKDLPQLRRKVFTLGLNSADPAIYQQISTGQLFCAGPNRADLAADCDRLLAMQALFNEKDKRTGWEFIAIAEKASKESRAAWYAAAFTKGSKLPTPVLQHSMDEFVKSANHLDPVSAQLTLFSFRKSFKKIYEDKIADVERESKIIPRLDQLQASIQKRVRDIARVEQLGTSAIEIPDPELKVYVLGRLSKVYDALANEMRSMPEPKGLKDIEKEPYKQMLGTVIDPIAGKAAQIGQQAWEISAQSGIPTPYSPEAVRAQFAGVTAGWDIFSALNRGLSANGKDHPWAKAIQGGNFYAALFFNQLVEENAVQNLNLGVEDQTILQMLTHYQMGRPSEMVRVAAAKESLLKGESLRLSILSRLFEYTLAQSPTELAKLRQSFVTAGLKDQAVGELDFLKVSETLNRIEPKGLTDSKSADPKADPNRRQPAASAPAAANPPAAAGERSSQ